MLTILSSNNRRLIVSPTETPPRLTKKVLFEMVKPIYLLPLRPLCVSAPLRWKIFNRRDPDSYRGYGGAESQKNIFVNFNLVLSVRIRLLINSSKVYGKNAAS